jgi:SET domain-containing protein
MVAGMGAAAAKASTARKRKRGDLSDEQLAARQSGRHYIFDLGCGLSVDASHCGNATRYLNHASSKSSQANVRAQVTNHFGCRRVVFYARRQIQAGEELCYDYGEGFKRDCGIKLI